MSKKKKKQRQARQSSKARKPRKSKAADHAAKLAKRERETSLDELRQRPKPELAPAFVLMIGACIPVLAVRSVPTWPAWGYVLLWLGCLLVATVIARKVAQRRTPKWDPALFFGVGGLAALLTWTQDAGEMWVIQSGKEATHWSVDGGLEHELEAGGRARLDLRAGTHRLVSGQEIVSFELARGGRIVLGLGPTPCVEVGGLPRNVALARLAPADPDPQPCRDALEGAEGDDAAAAEPSGRPR